MIPLIRSIFASFAILAAGLLPHFSPSAQAAEIQVLGNSLEIVDGDSIPRVEDRTFFGLLTLGAGSLTQTFTIKNLSTTAGDNLNLTGTPRVVIGGANPGDYVVTTQPAVSVAPGGSTTFVITWTPTFGDTIHRATLSIANNDSNENPYDFAIEATVTLTLNYAAGPNGSLSGDVAQGGFEARTAVTAVPNSGYHFVNWSDGSAANPRIDLNVTQNVNVTANFAIGGYTLAYTAGANGSLTGTTPQTVTHGTSGTAVNAVPATGYSFVNWSDGSTANPRTDTNVMTNKSVTANFAINTYTLTYAAGANGSLTGTTPQTVNHGSSGTVVTAVPATGYSFVNWSDGVLTAARTDTNVTADLSVTANFAINTYTLTYISGPFGVIAGTTPQTVTHGASGTTVTAVAAANARFVDWSDGSTANPRTDTNVMLNVSVTANFLLNTPTPPLPTVTLNGAATVTMRVNSAYTELGAFSGPSAIAAGAYHSLALRSDGTVATSGWVDQWNDWGQKTIPAGLSNVVAISAGSYHNLALRSDGTVVAWGRNDSGQVTLPVGLDNVVAIAAGGAHSLALRSDGTVVAWGSNDFSQVALPAGLDNVVAIAAGGYHNLALRSDGTVVAWGYNDYGQTSVPAGLSNVVAINAGYMQSLALRSDGTLVSLGYGQATIPAGLTAAGFYHSLELRSDGTVVGWDQDGQMSVYVPATVSGSVDTNTHGNYVLTYSATNFLGGSSSTTRTVVVLPTLTYTAGANGSLTGSTPQFVVPGASGSAVTAVPATGYHFVNWSDGSIDNPRTDTNVTANVDVTANFAIDTFTLTYTAGANGSLTGTTPQTVNYGSRGTSVTAVPGAGYHFVSWSDGATANPRTDTNVMEDRSVTANFAIGGNTLTYTAGANGSLTGATPQTVNHGSAGTTVTAVPATGYSFVSWSDGSPINPRTETNVMMNVNVTANFQLILPGNLDPDFYPDANGTVSGVAVQPDGKVLIGGSFTTVLGVARNRIARLNADGTLDMDFNPNASGSVFSLAVQADGKVLLGGAFLRLQPNGAATATARLRFARLNADGTLDEGFNPRPNGSGTSTTVTSVAVQADGKVLIGGNFRTLQPNDAATATPRQYIARLNADGTLDPDFNPNANNSVQSVAVQADGKVLIGGGFSTLQPNGAATATPRNRIARLNADGSLDMDFDPNANGSVLGLAVQADGKVLIGGDFGALQPNGAATATTRNRIARLNADGTLDEGFGPKANGTVRSLAVQSSGKVLIGGEFTTLQPNGAATATTRNRIARLDNDAATQTLSIPGATQALWSRGGAAPELTRVTFEVSTDGAATWGTLIAGTRLGTTANWQATGLSLPAGSLLRARGVTSGGYFNGSSGLIEQVTSFSTLTYTAGANGTLTGTTPQWVVPGANGTAVTAVPASGYHFVNWSDGSTANPRTDTNVTADLSVTASFLPNPAPEVDVLSPATGLTTGGTSVTIYGINFLGASSVTFGGTEATIVSVTDTEITVTSPAHAAGAVNVVVTTPGGSSTDVPTFTYIAPLSALDTWRSAWYGPGASNTGNAANTADPYHTGIPNLLVFAFFGPNQDPATAQIRLLPQVSASGGFLIYHFSEPVGVSGLSYGAEWSTTLQAGDWQAVTDMGVTPGEHLFRVPMDGAKKFLRLVVMPTP